MDHIEFAGRLAEYHSEIDTKSKSAHVPWPYCSRAGYFALGVFLRVSVRHTDAFPNSARLVRVSCLECVFRVHASVVPPV